MAFQELLPAVALVSIFFTIASLLRGWRTTIRLPFPPGPKPKFLLGNFFDIPSEQPWLTYTEWGKQYGDIVHAQMFGNHILILNSVKAATELLEKRAILYSDRPAIPMIPLLAAAIIMATVYGHDIQTTHDRFVHLAEEAAKRFGQCFLPGCGFHRFARETARIAHEMNNAPFDFVRRNMRDGVGRSSVLSELLYHNDTQYGGSREREETIKNVTGIAYLAAAETTSVALVLFIMAMALNPEVVKKAQNEIDTVVGIGFLPGFEHRSALPYCEAVVREVFRWRPIVPLAFAHVTSEDDIYEGYFIPKGTTVLPNVWAMVHDESRYPDPDKFSPERFLNADGQLNADDHILAFGFVVPVICRFPDSSSHMLPNSADLVEEFA
ncbi:Cytochrome P450 [Mycena sanguinolenta]|uniref:Cytochrome P450 n=1 Tax=Mycena sanguinolenta TaxID=230812 RepID=A0A8H7CV19_9AGAR|nr:Cytochrome P450 [Mycena sanguinolenta]